MITLAFDTCLDKMYVVLKQDNRILASKIVLNQDNKYHSAFLISTIQEVLSTNNIKPQDINLIAVNIGPGSFTGVRLGITVAKTLAYTLNIPIKCLSSIEALAVSSNSQKAIIIVEDPKGKYYGIIDNNEAVNEIKYASNKDFEELIKTSYEDYQIINNIRLDLEKIYIYAANIKPTPAHAVKARYVKGIEALNGK